MKKAKRLTAVLTAALAATFAFAACGVKSSETEEMPALSFQAENDPHIVKDGDSIYYMENGAKQSGVFGFYNNNLYYFSHKDGGGVAFSVVQITERVISVSVSGGSSVFIVEGDERGLVIDTAIGIGDMKDMVAQFLGDKPYDVVMTHTQGSRWRNFCLRHSIHHAGRRRRRTSALGQRGQNVLRKRDRHERHILQG